MFQQCIIVGNVGQDPELQYTPQGVAVCKFSVAVSKVTGKGDERKEKTTWFRCTAWRERAETVSQYVKKGQRLMVIGEVSVSAYTNKQGEPAASLELTANDFKFLSSKRESEDGGDERPAQNYRRERQQEEESPADIPF